MPDDDEPKTQEERDDKYGVSPHVPEGVDWDDFLVRMGWTDEEVLNRQRACWVHERWNVFKFELVCGLLEPKPIF